MNNDSKFIWLHLGASSFHRAHQSWYLNRLKEEDNEGYSWSLSLANIRKSDVSQNILRHLFQQNGIYTLEIISPNGNIKYKKIDSIDNVILWDKGLKKIVSEGARKETKVISFTVTEGGYYFREDGRLDVSDPEVQADLIENVEPTTLYGVLVRIMQVRMMSDSGPVTLLSCDNLRSNGSRFLLAFIEFVEQKKDNNLLSWIKNNISAPNSMVDRITPRFNDEIYSRLEKNSIYGDKVPVSCEEFSQWIIEDKFIAIRPNLEKVGVEFVDDVLPYEEAKIRVLNASHSCVAWTGSLLGKYYVDESLLPDVQKWIRDYILQDVSKVLSSTNINLDEYCEMTLKRFSNKWVRDTNQRVSSDSIAKVNEFILPTMKSLYDQGVSPTATLIFPALYFRFMQKSVCNGLIFEYQDRASEKVNFKEIFTSQEPLINFSKTKNLFGSLTDNPAFLDDLRNALRHVDAKLDIMREHEHKKKSQKI
ncbi:D-arabinitol 4-dehydrogenase [Brenneria populi subsp. brevivirga]|uniref:D-arabinitol 4-dehydrogenase n=1 Tax=Brenneria populi TaxID=1505588 RepID=UPI002E179437|nr:D-arabinitol 4-dehydrogenase [Brenneria populi subsp. brevivirga]